ncbi:PIG-L deacetylase family protein [Nocardia thailandica]|uniref:PIG-L deacetylase family protein n=1 Tax=Nocardia thailandica TaxID=257275 RepID=UPI0003118D51|nr:PIG-L family deacetylase [Nocardia thailandica]
MIPWHTGPLTEIAVLGAHCDDIPIGLGATLLTLTAALPGVRVRALVLTGAGTAREDEERAALAAFCGGTRPDLTVRALPDGRTPAHWGEVKDAVREFRAGSAPDLVFAPHTADPHQDHRLLAELVTTEFRDHPVLRYEIPKWDTESWHPTVYVPFGEDLAARKAALLREHYPSQAGRDWFDDRTFLGLARVRGVQCRAPYAEAFTSDKLVLQFGSR